MAWKYKQEYVRDGDVVEPSDFRINVNEFTSEINGFLDSDNIAKGAINVELCEREAFTAVFSNDINSIESYVFRHDLSGWQKTAQGTINKDAGSSSGVSNPAATDTYTNTTRAQANKKKLPSITFTPDQDGLLICEMSGFVDWLDYSLDESTNKPSKINNTRYQYGYFGKQTKKYKLVNSMVLCSMWRLTVNGQSVAETGPIGNDYRAHPFNPINKTGDFSFRHDCSLNCPMLIATYRKR